MFKIGHSHDRHRLEKGRKLIIGGEELNHDMGLVGHSDADVLVHAIAESFFSSNLICFSALFRSHKSSTSKKQIYFELDKCSAKFLAL